MWKEFVVFDTLHKHFFLAKNEKRRGKNML